MPKLQHIRSATPDKRPDPALLVDGQLSINTAATTPGVYTKNDAGGLIKVGPTHIGATAPNSAAAGSAGNSVGEHWMDTSAAPPVLRVWDGASWLVSQGLTGPAGTDGAAGGQGPAGNDGAAGAQGPPGNDGAAGAQGPAGNDGAAGPQGPAGNDGATGPQGPQGEVGPSGTPADGAFVKIPGDTMTGALNINAGETNYSLITDGDVLIAGNRIGSGAGNVYTNTSLGAETLSANTAGFDNTAVGTEALLRNTIGESNSAIGKNSLHFNISGKDNAAIGTYSLQSNTSGNANTACGKAGLFSNVDGTSNSSLGSYAMFNNVSGSFNTALGLEALKSNTAGSYNTAAGVGALNNNSVGSQNTCYGVNALYANSSGNYNTALGLEAGMGGGGNPLANTTGVNNTFIGAGAIGASGEESHVITLGNGQIVALRCQVPNITALSDARDKTNISRIPAGLGFINALNPVAFEWNTRDGAKVGIPEFGFIAQELLEVQALTGITVPNLVSTVNPDKLEASVGTLLPVLVNAVQELTTMVKDLQTELSTLKGA